MIWAIISSRSCICWLYRASPSSTAENIINLMSVLTIWWCPCVESSLVYLEEGACYDQCILLANFVSLCPASFYYPRPNVSVTPGVFWLPTFALQSPIMKRTSFLGVLVLKGLVDLHRTVQLQLLQHYWSEHTCITVILNGFLETNRDHSVIFEIASKYCILDCFLLWFLLHFF